MAARQRELGRGKSAMLRGSLQQCMVLTEQAWDLDWFGGISQGVVQAASVTGTSSILHFCPGAAVYSGAPDAHPWSSHIFPRLP